MEKDKTDIVNENNFEKHFSYLNEDMKKKSNEMIHGISYIIEEYKKCKKYKKNLNTDTKEYENLKKSIEKKIKHLHKTINKGECVNDFDDNKLIIEYYYNEKKDKLWINDIYLYEKIKPKKHFLVRNSFDIVHFLFYLSTIVTYVLTTMNDGSSLENQNILCFILLIYILFGAVFLYIRFQDSFSKDYRLKKMGRIEYYKTEKYISKKEDTVSFIELGYLFPQLLLTQATIVQNSSKDFFTLILCISLITYIYFFINLFHLIFKLSRVKGVFYILCLIVTFIIGLIEKDNWVAVALVVAIISILISEDIWSLYRDESPLSGRYDTLANKDIVTKNIFNLKLIIGTYVLILYLSVLILEKKHFSLEFFNKLPNGVNIISQNGIQAKLFDGLDKLGFISIFYLFYVIINKILIKYKDTTLLNEIITPISSIIYNKIGLSKLDLMDNYDKLSEENIKKYPELIINNSKYIPEGTKFLIEEHKDGDILKIVYPDKEIEFIKLNNLKKLILKSK